MEYLSEYAMFLAKTATLVLAIIAIISAIAVAGRRHRKAGRKGSIKVSRLNWHIDEMRDTLRHSVLDKHQLKLVHKEEKQRAKARDKEQKARLRQAARDDGQKRPEAPRAAQVEAATQADQAKQQEAAQEAQPKPGPEPEQQQQQQVDGALATGGRKRVFVLNFKGNIVAEAIGSLREEITAVLSLAEASDEVLLRLESPGGLVHAYGLASSQLMRIRNAGIPLTISVDKVAASGGYMMACLADRLVAAPFAIIGSIGVLVQLPNFHRLLKKHDVDWEMISAGEHKRTLTTFGHITQKGRDKAKEDVESIHGLFKDWVKQHRPAVEIDSIATGETWVGVQAQERNMVDELKTSDECIVEACESADVFEVEFVQRKSFHDRLGRALEESAERVLGRWLERSPNEFHR